jgi:hypothetical protein
MITNTKDLYHMKQLERHIIDNNSSIVRVPGGWVYGDLQGCCFVPLSNEFMETEWTK